MRHPKHARQKLDDEGSVTALHKRLIIHVDENIYPHHKWEGHQHSKNENEVARSIKKFAHVSADEMDDLVSPLSIETYVTYRTAPTIACCEHAAPRLALVQQALEVTSFVLNSLGAALAAFSQVHWVALAVACSTLMSSILDYLNLGSRVQAHNAAVQDLHNMLVYWNGASMIEHRTRACKEFVVRVTENASLSLISALTNSTARVSDEVSVAEKEDEHAQNQK